MNIKKAAQRVKKLGRNGDTILAHINPEEAEVLRRGGGSGRINPNTGIPEFGGYEGGGTDMSGGYEGGDGNDGGYNFGADTSAFGGGLTGGSSLGPSGFGADLGLSSAGDTGSVAGAFGSDYNGEGGLSSSGSYTSPNPIGNILGAAGTMMTGTGLGTALSLGGKLANQFASPVSNSFGPQTAYDSASTNSNFAGGSNYGVGSDGGGYGDTLANMYGAYAPTYNNPAEPGTTGYTQQGIYQDEITTQMKNLADMYGQDSPYAKELRLKLGRADAASGRNSQYGPREVQLQALLADKAMQAGGTIGTLATQRQGILDSQNQNYNRSRTGDINERTYQATAKTADDIKRAQQLSALYRGGSALADVFSNSSAGGSFIDSLFG